MLICLVAYGVVAMHFASVDCPSPCAKMTQAEWHSEMEHKFYGPHSWQFTSFYQRYDDIDIDGGRRCTVRLKQEPVS